MPALPSWLADPLWDQFAALLPVRPTCVATHPWGCHRRRIGDRVVFDKLIQVLRFGCSYEAIADTTCSATTLRTRRDEWIELGVFGALARIARQAYDRIVGLVLDEIAVDGCITKAPGGGEACRPVPGLGDTSRSRRRSTGSSRLSALSIARSTQPSLGRGSCRRSTATSWRSTRISTSLTASERASSDSQLSTRASIRYASRMATPGDHAARGTDGDCEVRRPRSNALIRRHVTDLGTHRRPGVAAGGGVNTHPRDGWRLRESGLRPMPWIRIQGDGAPVVPSPAE